MRAILHEVEYGSYGSISETGENHGLKLIERRIYDSLADSTGIIREMCIHMVNSGGKRIRPLLVLYSGLVFSEESDDLINAAVAAELIHMASLVHDDIIDNSALRRNQPSVNKKWGNHFGVLCGDYLFAKAFGILSGNRLLKSLDFMVEAIENMCSGEITQATNRFNHNMDLKAYYEQISKKTAIFLECCCKSGACIGGADDSQIAAIGEYGFNIGLAFQITDDILDFYGNSAIMGKPKGEDLRQGIITLPVIFLLNDERYRSFIGDILRKGVLEEQDIRVINECLHKYGAIDKSYKMAAMHIEKARKCLESLPKSRYAKFLYDLADSLKLRES